MTIPENSQDTRFDEPLPQEQIDDLHFARSVMSTMGSQLRQYGRPRIPLAVLGISAAGQPVDGVIDRTWRSVETIQELSSLNDETGTTDLRLASQLLQGLATNLSTRNHARVNLRELGVDDTVRSTSFTDQLQRSLNTLGNIVRAQI